MVVVLLVAVVGLLVGLLLQVVLRHDVVLLHRYALVLEEVAENSLEVDHDHRVVQLVWPTFEEVPVGPLEKLISLWVQLHFNIFLLDLLLFLEYGLLALNVSYLVLA